jgi:phosphatidylserine decarboxylase
MWAMAVTVCAILFILIVLNFYRDPDRTTPEGERNVISPADGKVIVVREVTEQKYIGQQGVQISIFMSPVDVHVNRIPVTGVVELLEHIPGSYKAAFTDKSSDENERTCIGIRHRDARVFFKQISGSLARRIVTDIRTGQIVQAGERFGMIKLGSRVDVVVPRTAEIAVKLNDRVVAGESILARLSPGGK